MFVAISMEACCPTYCQQKTDIDYIFSYIQENTSRRYEEWKTGHDQGQLHYVPKHIAQGQDMGQLITPSYVTWRQSYLTTMDQEIICCLTAAKHYLTWCRLENIGIQPSAVPLEMRNVCCPNWSLFFKMYVLLPGKKWVTQRPITAKHSIPRSIWVLPLLILI